MILLADSGKHQDRLVVLEGNRVLEQFQSDGLNPVHLPVEMLEQKNPLAEGKR
jgi:hypothetical protein